MNTASNIAGCICALLCLIAAPASANQGEAARSSGGAIQASSHRLHIDADWRLGSVDVQAQSGRVPPYVGRAVLLAQSASDDDGWFFTDTPILIGVTVAPGLMVLPSTDLSTDGGLIARYKF